MPLWWTTLCLSVSVECCTICNVISILAFCIICLVHVYATLCPFVSLLCSYNAYQSRNVYCYIHIQAIMCFLVYIIICVFYPGI